MNTRTLLRAAALTPAVLGSSWALTTVHAAAAPHTAATASASTTSTSTSSSVSTTQRAAVRRVVRGRVVAIPFGDVQVRIVVRGSDVRSVTALRYPSDNPHSAQLSSYALPILEREAVQSNSANIDSVSGASWTSAGFKSSLQSALNRAGL